ncbi:MAG TPA: terminase family protein [Bryobacteraceae bacterium]|nr:terminase family protein [Bryobacteraceae bacterium]
MGGTERITREIEYQPLPSQQKFHRSKARFKGFSGPVGCGKSQALCHEAIRLSYINRGRLGLIGAPTYPMLRDATLVSFIEVLARNEIPYEFNKAESVLTMRDSGSRILFRAVDEFERLRGTNLAWFGIDELTYTSEEAWLRLEGRLRDQAALKLCGFAVWTPKGFDWVYKRFIRAPVSGYEAILAAPYENRHILSKIPDFYERLRRSYDERFFEQEVLGAYLNVNSGAVYSSFGRERNVRALRFDRKSPLFWALDFNVDPMSSIVAQMHGEEVWVLDEIVLSRASTEQACEEFHARFPNHQMGIVVYGDASGSRLQTAGTTDYRIIRDFLRSNGYEKYDLKVPKKNPNIRDRVSLVNSRLWSAEGVARLFISPKCKELLKDMEEVTYKPGSSVIDKDRDPKRTHLSDALGYLVWQECRAQAPFGEQEKPLV